MPERLPEAVTSDPRGTGPDSAVEVTFAAVEALVPDELTLEQVGAVAAPAVSARRRLRLGAWFAIGWMVAIIALAILAPVLPLDDPDQINADCVQKGFFTPGHPMGCDGIGRDLLSRNIWGARASLLVGVGSIVIGFALGGSLGLIAGFHRGRLDSILTAFFDLMLAFPQLILALTLVSVLATKDDTTSTARLGVLIVALGIVGIPIVARITRANTLSWAQREFVLAARAQGAKNRRIIVREVLPNVLPAMFSISLLGIAVAIVAEGGLSVLGVGVQLPTPSWGNIISVGVGDVEDTPWVVFGAAGFIFLTVLSLNYLGDVVRARFDVRESAL
jgi:peptide/nickel transport system permease protein